MKMKLVLVMFFFLMNINAFSQEMSDASKELAEQLRVGNTKAILDAGSSGDKSLIPYLRSLDPRLKRYSTVALAKLGDEATLQAILKDVEDTDPSTQDQAMSSLGQIGGKTAYKRLYELLDDTKPRPNPECERNAKVFEEYKKTHADAEYSGPACDVIFFNKSVSVIEMFSRIFKDYPDIPPRASGPRPDPENWSRDLIVLWKAWFANHKYLIE